jgi:hypothetical protein
MMETNDELRGHDVVIGGFVHVHHKAKLYVNKHTSGITAVEFADAATGASVSIMFDSCEHLAAVIGEIDAALMLIATPSGKDAE